MKDIEFNLIDEPWIRVAHFDGEVEEKSLIDVLSNAHQYKSLAGEMAAQDIAILRFLVAIIHTVFTRVNTEGMGSCTAEEDECIERWKSIWERGMFPEQLVRNYLHEWKERFWLFHPERPFYQVPQASIGTKNTASKLNGAVSESNNKVRLFSQISGIGKSAMTYAEGARWLLFLNGFDDCAAKQADKSNGSRGSTISWLGKLGLIYAVGENLFETIMLNMPMLHGKDELPWKDDIPTWELKELRSKERETIEMPDNLAGLFTLQSRRIILNREEKYVTGYALLGGDAFEDINALGEPMTLWRIIKDKKTGILSYRPLLHERKRYIWRNFSALTAASESDMKPGIISWCDRLRRERILQRKRVLTFGIVCVRYDSSQSSSITDSFADDVIFHADLLSESGKYWREEIYKQIEKIDKAAFYIGTFVGDLRRSDGLNPKEDEASADAPRQELYYDVDRLFRTWLMKIDVDQDEEERNIVALELESSIRNICLSIGRDLIDQAGESAFIGRTVEDKKKKTHYCAPEVYRWFKNNIWKLYPDMKGVEASD